MKMSFTHTVDVDIEYLVSKLKDEFDCIMCDEYFSVETVNHDAHYAEFVKRVCSELETQLTENDD